MEVRRESYDEFQKIPTPQWTTRALAGQVSRPGCGFFKYTIADPIMRKNHYLVEIADGDDGDGLPLKGKEGFSDDSGTGSGELVMTEP